MVRHFRSGFFSGRDFLLLLLLVSLFSRQLMIKSDVNGAHVAQGTIHLFHLGFLCTGLDMCFTTLNRVGTRGVKW